jgi:hypothetical protein
MAEASVKGITGDGSVAATMRLSRGWSGQDRAACVDVDWAGDDHDRGGVAWTAEPCSQIRRRFAYSDLRLSRGRGQ